MTTCLSNEKQIGLAMLQYMQDSDQTFPNGNGPGGSGWAGEVYPYIRSTNVFICPDDIGAHGGAVESYGINEILVDSYNHWPDNTPLGGPMSLGQLNAPARTVLVCEIVECTTGGAYTSPSNPQETTSPSVDGLSYSSYRGENLNVSSTACTNDAMGTQIGAVYGGSLHAARHQNGSNFLLADGHSKYFNPGRVSPGFNALTTYADETSKGSATTTGQAAGAAFGGNSALTGGPFDATFSAI